MAHHYEESNHGWKQSVQQRQSSLGQKTYTVEEIIKIIESMPFENKDVYSWEDYTTHPRAFIDRDELIEKLNRL